MRRDSRRQGPGLALFIVVGSAILLATGVAAHKPITSPFTFYEDVLPITQARCGDCHAPDGVAPMSLLTPEAAVPWAESMRLELVAGHMPPGSDVWPRDRFTLAPPLTARELNVLLTWATGGTPPGDPDKAVAAPPPSGWRLGVPAQVLPLPRLTLDAGESARTSEIVLPLGPAPRAFAAVDFRPGTPAIVRSVRIAVREHGSGSTPERVVGLWVPGDRAARLPDRAVWTVGPGAELVVRTTYRKRWDREREPAFDESAVALYEADGPPGAPATALEVAATTADATTRRMVAATMVARPVRVLALWPDQALAGASVRVHAIEADGSRALLAAFDARAGWERRLRLAVPERLAGGTRVEVAATWEVPERVPPPGARLLGLDVIPAD